MGGARCSYQNCSQKSDKKTHMFHYPVFDKMRCHQWITNAQKLNYLNLKLSQLKNRMVCQHHFTDDCFMNEMQNKLKNTAVPTELGPYCVQSYLKDEDEAQSNRESELPINLDDIENEFMPKTDRKAHLSVKYGDFLINDVTEAITLTPECKSTSIMLQDKGLMFNRHVKNKCTSPNYQKPLDSCVKKKNLRVSRIHNKKRMDESLTFENKCVPKIVSVQFDEPHLNANGQVQGNGSESVSLMLQKPSSDLVTITEPPSSLPLTKKVRIISEKHIAEPVKIPAGELRPVSPSVVIKVPDKRKRSNIGLIYVDAQTLQPTKIDKGFDNTMIAYTQPPCVTDQMHLNTYTQPTIYEGQIGLDNLSIQNAEPDVLRNTKAIEYLPSQAQQGSQPLEQETGMFVDHNMSTAPNLEFVSSSLTGSSVFTLTDVPQMSNSAIDSSHGKNVSSAPQNALLPMVSEMFAANQEQVSDMSIKPFDTSIMRDERSVVSEKPVSESNGPKKSMVRYKMPPQKLAAIEEKRKYNLKLRDIINSCLNNMDEDPDVEKLTAAMKKELNKKKVGEHLSNEPTTHTSRPQSQENVISYFEARLQRMEDTLLNRIEHNSQKITDLKKTVAKQFPIKKSTSTQTYFTALETKRTVYQQVSQYLSPDLNSLIYEELFLNQRISKVERKRRKRRHDSSEAEL